MSEEIAPSEWLPSNARPPKSATSSARKPASGRNVAEQKAEPGWEYKTVRVPGRNKRRDHEKALNKMSEKGWELVSVNWGGLLRATDIATFRRQR